MVSAGGFSAEQIEGMRQVYLETSSLHHLTFEQCLDTPAIRICLKNTALARRRAIEARRRQAPENFELTP